MCVCVCVCVCVCEGLCVSDIHGSWAQFKFPPQCRGSVERKRERGGERGRTDSWRREGLRWHLAKITHCAHTQKHTHTHTTSSSIKRTVVSFDVMLGTRPPRNSTGNFLQIARCSEAASHTTKWILISVHKPPSALISPEDGHHYWSQAAYKLTCSSTVQTGYVITGINDL